MVCIIWSAAKKPTRQWAAWTHQEEESFFTALRQVGKVYQFLKLNAFASSFYLCCYVCECSLCVGFCRILRRLLLVSKAKTRTRLVAFNFGFVFSSLALAGVCF